MKTFITIFLCFFSAFVLAQDTITIAHHRYTTTFDTVLRYPVKVHWIVADSDVCAAGNNRHVGRTNDFRPDPAFQSQTDLQPFYHAISKNYDRGHNMDAADNSCNISNMHECFYFSNMTAQTKHLNEITWEKLEEHTRDVALQFSKVEVWCGSYGITDKSGPMTIPAFCWKVLRYNGTTEAYIFPNTATVNQKPYTDYASTVDSIRTASGLGLAEIPQ
jgi:DNA/RNA endonuclease G (NUC1)